ncbi:META domain-containing protein [Gordonia hydrophobica]|uniref:META domain-containing protein n=1 Tax=Gordonia hydrophobica TaxID=40516 RepID=A0ABZ2U1D5_9ACTN|nr:META domain-containing protein [Gordonia hydrophobica]MBM7368954.1 heat shock protein HslJ [Gordonia hydrophobica]
MSVRHRIHLDLRRRRPRRRAAVGGVAAAVLLAATVLTGCSDADADVSSDPADLVGKTFLSTDGTTPAVPGGGPLVLAFTPGHLSANAGCNGHGGTVVFDGDTMTAGRLMGTMMACPPPRDGADRWVSDLFGAPLTWRLDGAELHLSRGDRAVVLTERVNRPIVGTHWRVTALVKHEAVSSSAVLDERKPFFQIATDGTLSGNTGCNAMTGSATVDDDTIDFAPIATTRKACAAEITEIERTVLAALRGETTVKVDGDSLALTNVADGNLGLRLTAVGD